jgi:hypothetical protein
LFGASAVSSHKVIEFVVPRVSGEFNPSTPLAANTGDPAGVLERQAEHFSRLPPPLVNRKIQHSVIMRRPQV